MKDFIINNFAATGANHYLNHQRVREAYPDATPHPLYRVESRDLRIRANTAPGADLSFETEEIYLPKTGETIEFELVANCIKRFGHTSKHAQIYPHYTDWLNAWFYSRAHKWGFTPETIEVDSDLVLIKKEGSAFEMNYTIFSGTLTVLDSTIFSQHLETGFSSAKAFGFGLMTTRPL